MATSGYPNESISNGLRTYTVSRYTTTHYKCKGTMLGVPRNQNCTSRRQWHFFVFRVPGFFFYLTKKNVIIVRGFSFRGRFISKCHNSLIFDDKRNCSGPREKGKQNGFFDFLIVSNLLPVYFPNLGGISILRPVGKRKSVLFIFIFYFFFAGWKSFRLR